MVDQDALAPRLPFELQCLVEGDILAYKLEPDGDVIIGADQQTMVAEPALDSRLDGTPADGADSGRQQQLRLVMTGRAEPGRRPGSRPS